MCKTLVLTSWYPGGCTPCMWSRQQFRSGNNGVFVVYAHTWCAHMHCADCDLRCALCCAVSCAVLQIIDAIFEQDPNGATLAFADMMKKQIVMPAHLMDDGQHETTNKGRNLFAVSASLLVV